MPPSSQSKSENEDVRLLEVNVKSAILDITKKDAKTYAKVSINPNQKLKTRSDSRGPNPIWREKFVFSLSNSSLAKSSIRFKIYQHGGLFDSPIGTAFFNLKSLFKLDENECKYDTENEEEEPELRASASLNIVYDDLDPKKKKGVFYIEVTLWKGCIKCVGKNKWHNLAMSYDAFMGMKLKDKGEKHHSCMCFTSGD